MRKSRWSSERTAALVELVDLGLHRRDIAARLGVRVNAVSTKLYTMGLVVPLGPSPEAPAVSIARRALDILRKHPRFEDITPTAAAAVRRGAPASAPVPRPIRHTSDVSLTGNAAVLCTQ